jgi:predicted enzyme related to lactoylglutathione lyase
MATEDTRPADSGHVDEGLARHGHVSYLEIPAVDGQRSALFYEAVFGWQIRRRDSGEYSFEDGSGNLIGAWVADRVVPREPGLIPYIYVNRIDEVIQRIKAEGGEIVRVPYAEGNLWVATFRDPAGNLLGIWQAGPR